MVFYRFDNNDIDETIQFFDSNCRDNYNLLTSVRCAAHTLQLAIYDMVKENFNSKKLSEIRFICKKLRTTNMLVIINAMKLKKQKIDCATRWNSAFDMVERFMEYKNFCNEMETTYPFLKVCLETWKFAEKFVEILRPLKVATLKLQSEQLLIGDFYGLWLEIKLGLEQNESVSNIKSSLLNVTCKRET